jgi:hypothetical protein
MPQSDPYEIPAITRRVCDRVAGSDALVRAAEHAGVIHFTTTATGRQYATPNGFAALVRYVGHRMSG